jgi:hypothetical protein
MRTSDGTFDVWVDSECGRVAIYEAASHDRQVLVTLLEGFSREGAVVYVVGKPPTIVHVRTKVSSVEEPGVEIVHPGGERRGLPVKAFVKALQPLPAALRGIAGTDPYWVASIDMVTPTTLTLRTAEGEQVTVELSTGTIRDRKAIQATRPDVSKTEVTAAGATQVW